MRKVRNIPVPGMRVIKTALAVFLCLTIVGMLGEHYSGYSAIVAIVCMQKDLDNSVTMAINRSVGTLVGAAFGVLTYKLMELLPANSGYVLPYLIVAAMMVLLMVVIISLGKQAATAVTCIIFLSVAVLRNSEIDVSHVNRLEVPLQQGALLAIGKAEVNLGETAHRRHDRSRLDALLLDEGEQFLDDIGAWQQANGVEAGVRGDGIRNVGRRGNVGAGRKTRPSRQQKQRKTKQNPFHYFMPPSQSAA